MKNYQFLITLTYLRRKSPTAGRGMDSLQDLA